MYVKDDSVSILKFEATIAITLLKGSTSLLVVFLTLLQPIASSVVPCIVKLVKYNHGILAIIILELSVSDNHMQAF